MITFLWILVISTTIGVHSNNFDDLQNREQNCNISLKGESQWAKMMECEGKEIMIWLKFCSHFL
jgi:glutamate racemase